MLFEHNQELEEQPRRTKTLVVSLGIHALLVLLVVVKPDLLTSPPKRIIRIAGQDFDLSKLETQELTMQPPPNQAKPQVQSKPLVQPPTPQQPPQQAAPPPPPPPPPTPPAPPPVTISPEDVIADGA